jgi:hypothetical protein
MMTGFERYTKKTRRAMFLEAPDAPVRVVARGRNWRQVSKVKAKRLRSAVTLTPFSPSSF